MSETEEKGERLWQEIEERKILEERKESGVKSKSKGRGKKEVR